MALNEQSTEQNLKGMRGRDATPEEIAQRDGYVRGRNDENYVQRNIRAGERAVAQARANDNAASGMVFGVIIAMLAAAAGVAAYFIMGDRPAPVAVPQIERETVTEKETTIIERESPAPEVSLPDVQINVPEVSLPDVTETGEAPADTSEPKAEDAPPATDSAE